VDRLRGKGWLGLPLVLALVALPGGCSSDSDREHETFDPKTFVLPEPPRPEDEAPPVRDPSERLKQGLTLDEAVAIALEANPGLSANADGVNAAKARITEASVFTNPVFQFTKGDIPFRGQSEGNNNINPSVSPFDMKYGENVVSLTKDLDLSGKRVARVDAAIENERQSEAQYVSSSLQLKSQVHVAYAAILVADRNVELAREAMEMAKKNLEIVSGRALGGDMLPADRLRAEADSARSASDLQQAERDLVRAKRALATLLGAPNAAIGPLRNELPLSRVPEGIDDDVLAKEALAHNADVIAARRAVLAAEATLRLQNRSAVPDLTVGVQVNGYNFDSSYSGTLNLSIPLPIFDQNRGPIAEATALLHQAEKLETQTANTVVQGVKDDVQALRASRARIDVFEKEILPKDRESVKLTEASFQGGKILYLDVITARQTFNQARSDYVNELLNYESALADLERLLAHNIRVQTP
jgi:cobalt-zinc-cadmium efflux system outer membrane protein